MLRMARHNTAGRTAMGQQARRSKKAPRDSHQLGAMALKKR